LCVLVAFGLSSIGLRRDKRRLPALVTLSVSSVLMIVFVVVPSYVEFILSALGC